MMYRLRGDLLLDVHVPIGIGVGFFFSFGEGYLAGELGPDSPTL